MVGGGLEVPPGSLRLDGDLRRQNGMRRCINESGHAATQCPCNEASAEADAQPQATSSDFSRALSALWTPAGAGRTLPDRVEPVLCREQSVLQGVTKIDYFSVILRVLFAVHNGQDGSCDYQKALLRRTLPAHYSRRRVHCPVGRSVPHTVIKA
jgi:hypothetical protein